VGSYRRSWDEGIKRIKEKIRLFRNDLEAVFVQRPNRFLIIAESDGKKLFCHCPNPGRMTECLFPGVPLVLEKRDSSGTKTPKTAWTAAAVRYHDTIMPLYASRANFAAEKHTRKNTGILITSRPMQKA
jgi:sugar fermentation stimulation protein A